MPVSDQGEIQDRYKLIPRVLIFATHEDKVLLIKGSPKKRIWANLYNGIGGHVEKGEDILAAAHREFYEETGLELIDPWLCAVITIDTGKQTGIGMYVFRGEVSHTDTKPSEEGLLEWIPVDDIHKIPYVEDLPILIANIMKLNQSSSPLFLHYYYDGNDKLIILCGEKILSQD
jgi:8-oxo-dGTP diphosphatase